MHSLLIDWIDSLAHAVDLAEEDDEDLYFFALFKSFEDYPLQPCLPEGMYFLLPVMCGLLEEAAEAWGIEDA